MPNLRDANYVDAPIGVRSLAQLAGIRNDISVRELITLLGDRRDLHLPFYIIAHGTNSIAKVIEALNAGANAIEIDVTAAKSNLNQLCIDHPFLTGDAPSTKGVPHLTDFLRDLRKIVDTRPELTLVMFDCKPPAATPNHGRTIINAVRSILTRNTELNIIISVADVTSTTKYRLKGTTIFDQISSTLNPREGLMMDDDNDPDGVVAFFNGQGVAHSCYGNGTSFPFSDEGAMVYRTPIERACWLRVTHLKPRFVNAWTVNSIDNLRLYLHIGVNGMISDMRGVRRAVSLLKTSEYAARFRLAKRSDNPFLPANAFYGLTIRTSDVRFAGTDANVTITVNGANGATATTINTNYNRRMERDMTNFFILPSADLGELQSVTVRRDNKRFGPDWHLSSIVVESPRYKTHKTASFNCWIDNTSPFTRPLN